MIAPQQKSRLAIGIYDSLPVIGRPVSSLMRIGVRPQQLGLIAQRGVIESGLLPGSIAVEDWRLEDWRLEDWRLLAPLLLDTEAVSSALDPYALFASRGIVGLVRAGPTLSDGTQPPITGRRSEQLLSDTYGHLRAGRAALAVSSSSSDQQREIARVLLQSSAYPVEIHEFTIPE